MIIGGGGGYNFLTILIFQSVNNFSWKYGGQKLCVIFNDQLNHTNRVMPNNKEDFNYILNYSNKNVFPDVNNNIKT